jgi:flavin-dependent dehydrogenase
MYDTDVFILGAGPAGLAAAICARQEGLDVAVADHREPPLDKACGEGLMPDCMDALEALGISIDAKDRHPFVGIRFLNGERSVDARFSRGLGWGIRRTILHQLILDRALQLGVRFYWSAKFKALRDDIVFFSDHVLRSRWIVGADGISSTMRALAGLDHGFEISRRVGIRKHLLVSPWSEFVEIYWSDYGQAYVTPVSDSDVCVALITRNKHPLPFSEALRHFPSLQKRIEVGLYSSEARGSATVTRYLRHVTRGNLALIGDASGSVDAIAGEGLAMAFKQASALATAMKNNDLKSYERAHKQIRFTPTFMASSMLLMDKHRSLRERSFSAFERNPSLFHRMLSIHVGEQPLRLLGNNGIMNLGLQLMIQ